MRGKRLRRAFDHPLPDIDAWPSAWRELLTQWVRCATPDKRHRHEALFEKAGSERANAPPATWRLVENRSAFEKAAAARQSDEAVLRLPCYPPGWWSESITQLLHLSPAPATIACDPDPDGIGIAIAMQAGSLWEEAGQEWTPWRMNAADLRGLAHRRPLTDRDRALLEQLQQHPMPATLAGLATTMLDLGEKGEQESLFW
ncbi:DUF2399 domain-containing protein [Thauera sp. Sel9]|uniref:DUF2399 domain-containing protein n=1 Tax=Thauera sp. Sel9 TaxID=2974299 RepID=UPI0021E180A5|nr:DUF2399 domain-containing protein [Thauera sp. Sel9]